MCVYIHIRVPLSSTYRSMKHLPNTVPHLFCNSTTYGKWMNMTQTCGKNHKINTAIEALNMLEKSFWAIFGPSFAIFCPNKTFPPTKKTKQKQLLSGDFFQSKRLSSTPWIVRHNGEAMPRTPDEFGHVFVQLLIGKGWKSLNTIY